MIFDSHTRSRRRHVVSSAPSAFLSGLITVREGFDQGVYDYYDLFKLKKHVAPSSFSILLSNITPLQLQHSLQLLLDQVGQARQAGSDQITLVNVPITLVKHMFVRVS